FESSTARDALLAAAVDEAANHGISDVSLRQMASALGTSHRMLSYHFGSKEGLLVAVINEMERRQLEQLSALDVDPDVAPADQLRVMWKRLSDPKMWPHERLFYEI